MNKKYILKENESIQNIINIGIKKAGKFFVSYKITNTLGYNRFCVTVGKKLANAVKRNKLKRIIKDILSKNSILSSNDYVIIVRNNFLKLNYEEIKTNLLENL